VSIMVEEAIIDFTIEFLLPLVYYFLSFID